MVRVAIFPFQIWRRKDLIKKARRALLLCFRAGRLLVCGEGTLARTQSCWVYSGCTYEADLMGVQIDGLLAMYLTVAVADTRGYSSWP
jgi:hypothetical protein